MASFYFKNSDICTPKIAEFLEMQQSVKEKLAYLTLQNWKLISPYTVL